LCLEINATGNPGCTLFNSECTISAENTLRIGPGMLLFYGLYKCTDLLLITYYLLPRDVARGLSARCTMPWSRAVRLYDVASFGLSARMPSSYSGVLAYIAYVHTEIPHARTHVRMYASTLAHTDRQPEDIMRKMRGCIKHRHRPFCSFERT